MEGQGGAHFRLRVLCGSAASAGGRREGGRSAKPKSSRCLGTCCCSRAGGFRHWSSSLFTSFHEVTHRYHGLLQRIIVKPDFTHVRTSLSSSTLWIVIMPKDQRARNYSLRRVIKENSMMLPAAPSYYRPWKLASVTYGISSVAAYAPT